jgi:capsular polysaccharide biosynthesis protein
MASPNAEISKQYLFVVLRWLVIAISLFTLLVLGGYYLVNVILTKVYTATAQVEILNPTGDYLAEFEIIQSPQVLLPVIHNLDLDKVWAKRIYNSKEDPLADTDALAYLNQNLKIDSKRGSNIMEITVASGVPQEASKIANAIVDRYQSLRNLQQAQAHPGSTASYVRIISHADTPESPSRPDKNFDYIMTIIVAAFISGTIASFVEIIFLFSRAALREERLTEITRL